MMAVLIIKNIHTEGPGTIEIFLLENSIDYMIVELAKGQNPPSLALFSAMIILGGPMGVYEMNRYPHLQITSRLIKEAINRKMKIFGICLGAQMIAHCLGARVYKGPSEEIGWLDIELTSDGMKDPAMISLATHPYVGDAWKRFKVFHWHGDTFELPAEAVRLAGSDLYENQAFRYGDRVYAFQFHIEVSSAIISKWFENGPFRDKILLEASELDSEYSGRAKKFYKEFFSQSSGIFGFKSKNKKSLK